MKERVTIHVTTNERFTELCLLLQSLRTQTFQDFDIMILDDGTKVPFFEHHVFGCLLNRLKNEKHKIKLLRNDYKSGVCQARNKLIENDTFDNKYVCRLDDDVILNSDYLERLVNGIKKGYDMVSGLTPPIFNPEFLRRTKFVKPIINKIVYDKMGNVTLGDDCGHMFYDKELIPAHHLRSCFLYKKKITDEGLRYEKGISNFREETYFCVRAMLKGNKMAVDTGAVVQHFITPSGGCRPDYVNVNTDEEKFVRFMKERYFQHPNYLEKYEEMVL